MDNNPKPLVFFVCSGCKNPAYEIPHYEKFGIFHKNCSEKGRHSFLVDEQKKEVYDPTKPYAKIFLDGDFIVIHHPYNDILNQAYRKYFGFNWNKEKRRREINKKNINSINAEFLMKDIKLIAPEYSWKTDAAVTKLLDDFYSENQDKITKIQVINEIKKDFNADIDVSHLKIEPYGYQKAGIAFLETAKGVALVADEMGLGKCVCKKSNIFSSLGYFSIEKLFNENREENPERVDDDGGEWYKSKKEIKLYSINKKGQMEEKPLIHFYRQKINNKIKKVYLSDGSSVEITQPHKLLTLNGWTNNFKENDWVLIPRKIPGGEQKIDLRLVYLMAWLISEGYENPNHYLTIYQLDKNILKEIKRKASSYFKDNKVDFSCSLKKDKRTGCFYLSFFRKAVFNHLKELGYETGKKSAEKQIPQFILNSNDDAVRLFLRNYFEAEASVSKGQKAIEITSASEVLMEQLSFLLRRFGIWLRYKSKQKMATNGKRIKRTYYTGIISGTSLREYCKLIGFAGTNKQRLLEKLCKNKCNDNVDVIPTLDVCRELYSLKIPLRHLGISHPYLKRQNLSKKTVFEVINNLDKILIGETQKEYKKLKRSRWTNKILKIYEALDRLRLKELRDLLEYRLKTNAFYAKVLKIEYQYLDDYVYDLSVLDNHNYVANNVYCHNTIQALGYTSKHSLKTIVVTLASLKFNWKKEIEKFSHKSTIVLSEKTLDQIDKVDYVITNYDQLKKWQNILGKIKFQAIILDESHSIVNLGAARTKLVFSLFRKIPHRILLSGTPFKNKPIELYSQLKFLKPTEFPRKQDFGFRYCDPEKGENGYWEFNGASNLDELYERIAPFFIRRLKSEALKDLPPKRVSTIMYELDSAELKEYKKITNIIESDFSEKSHSIVEQKSRLMELQQFCSRQKVSRIIEYVTELLKEDAGGDKKVIIFAHFRETQRLLKDHFGHLAVSVFGNDSSEDRFAAQETFQNNKDIKVFVGSTKAAGSGLNLTAADTVIFADLLWTPADHKQAEDRAHRNLQTKNVFVYYMLFAGSIEESIWETIGKKHLMISQTIGDIPYEEEQAVREIIKSLYAMNRVKNEKK